MIFAAVYFVVGVLIFVGAILSTEDIFQHFGVILGVAAFPALMAAIFVGLKMRAKWGWWLGIVVFGAPAIFLTGLFLWLLIDSATDGLSDLSGLLGLVDFRDAAILGVLLVYSFCLGLVAVFGGPFLLLLSFRKRRRQPM
ncbi:MAG: hypothetical protein ACYTAF_12625 [Planctomycetota bacterium]